MRAAVDRGAPVTIRKALYLVWFVGFGLLLGGMGWAGEDETIVYPSRTVDPERIAASPITEKCYTCHGSDVAAREWATSPHIESLTTLRSSPRATDACLDCHSSGFRPTSELVWGLDANAELITVDNAINEVACSSCHSHANEDREAYLVRPIDQLCIQCHTMECGCEGEGIIAQSQGEMFLGEGGRGVPNLPSAHWEAMDGSCATCHMYRPPDADGKVLSVGGHTFRASYESCGDCHDDARAELDRARREVEALRRLVESRLDALREEAGYRIAFENAEHNVTMVIKDGGFGLHNPSYAKALLQRSLRYLDTLSKE